MSELVKFAAGLFADAVRAEISPPPDLDALENERQALLSMQRKISDELERRQLAK